MQLAQVEDIFGTIEPPPGMADAAGAGLGGLIATGISLFLLLAALFTVMYLLWGALDWITSGGEKERITKARDKITHAVIGIILIVVVLAIFQVIVGPILGIFDTSGNQWQFTLPTL